MTDARRPALRGSFLLPPERGLFHGHAGCMKLMLATRSSKNEHIHNAVEQGIAVMADSQQVDRPAAVTQAKRDSYLRHVRIHIELLQDSLTGREFGCGVGQGDREEIEKRLLD